MEDGAKKISFGFSKISKKTVISKPPEKVDQKQFIKSLEDKTIKLVQPEPEKKELVIPLSNGNALRDNLIEVIKNRHQTTGHGPKVENGSAPGESDADAKPSEEVEKPLETLDEMAAREILEDLKRAEERKNTSQEFSVPISQAADDKESTLEDYENIPVEDFGLAMLRGMGWKPGKGIGKNEKIVKATQPALRPKGMGLGADKAIKQANNDTGENPLPLIKGAFVKVLAGPYKNQYGTVGGFDELPGRVFVKLALSNNTISLNETMAQTVTKLEFGKNSKVININKYDEFKRKEESKDSNSAVQGPVSPPSEHSKTKPQRVQDSSDSSGSEYLKSKKLKKEKRHSPSPPQKYKKSKYRDQSESSSNTPKKYSRNRDSRSPSPLRQKEKKQHSSKSRKHRKSRHSSDSDSSRDRKKKKKVKKHRRRSPSSSPERTFKSKYR